jgi:hypothetical protein
MRILLIAFALAACGPTTATAPQTPSETPPAPSNAAALGATPATGQWFFQGDEGVVSADFGAPQSEPQLSIVCTSPTGEIKFVSDRVLAPDQATTLNVLTDTQTIAIAGQSHNDGLPMVVATVDAAHKAELVAALSASQQRFGVEVAGETSVYPWDAAIARALAECA